MSADVELCTATASACQCTLAAGHDEPHVCDPLVCGGLWSGDYGSDDFKVIAFPDIFRRGGAS